MKKIISILLLIACILAVFVGCSSNSTTTSTTNPNQTEIENSNQSDAQKEQEPILPFYDLNNFETESLSEKTEETVLCYDTGDRRGIAYLSFKTEDFYLRLCEDNSNAIIFNSKDEPIAKIRIQLNQISEEDDKVQKVDDFASDVHMLWSHFEKTIQDKETVHIAEYIHPIYGTLHISCKDVNTLDQITSSLNNNIWGGLV